MKVHIDHDHCHHGGAFADRCLGATIRNPLGHERPCMDCLEEDGRGALTVTLRMDGADHTLVLVNQHEQDIAANLGWVAFTEPH